MNATRPANRPASAAPETMTASRPQAAFEESLRQAHAALRAGRAATAERRLRTLQAQFPGEPNCLWLLGAALLEQNKIPESIATLEDLLTRVPDFAHARVDLARAYRSDGRAARAREEVRRVLEKIPHHHPAWLAYGDVLVDLEQYPDARLAFERARLTDPQRTRVEEATAALVADDRKTSERIFRGILQEDPSHVAALCGLAALSLAADKGNDAERLLRHALKQSAHHPLAWRGLGQALAAYEQAARLQPGEVRLRMSIGHIYKTLGRRNESEAAYKAALAMDPAMPDAYWSLADLKNYAFNDAEIAAMQQLLTNDQ